LYSKPMQLSRYIKDYSLSPLGIANGGIALLAGFVVGSLTGFMAGLLSGAASLVAIFVLALYSGSGPRFAAAEQERRLWAAGKERLAVASAKQKRLASMRVPDAAVKQLVDLAAMQAGMFIGACQKNRQRDPLAEDAISECVDLVDLYLKELDDASTERRYAMPDDDPFADAVQRVSAALRDKVAMLEKARLDIEGGLQREDRMAIKEQL
jgi:hypothetical protein